MTLVTSTILNSQEIGKEKRVNDPDNRCSIQLAEGWQSVGEAKRTKPHVTLSEFVADDKSRLVMVVTKKSGIKNQKLLDINRFTMLLVNGLTARSDAKAVRDTRGFLLGGNLKAIGFHVFHSQGKIIAETQFVVTQDDNYYYAFHGTCKVSKGKKRSAEINDMINSFRIVEHKR